MERMCLHYEEQMISRNQKQKILPITLVTGFLGSGKTTLLRNLLQNKLNLKLACAVTDMAAINLDEQIIAEESVVLNNGCHCYPFILEESNVSGLESIVWKLLSTSAVLDYLIIETSGTTDPIPIVSSLQANFGKMTRARLDAVVTVIDASAWEEESFTPCDTMLNQISVADIILLNKTDLLLTDLDTIKSRVIKYSHPGVQIYDCSYGKMPLPSLLDVSSPHRNGGDSVTHEARVTEPKWIPSDIGGHLRNAPPPSLSSLKCSDKFTSVVLKSTSALSLSDFTKWLLKTASTDVLRIKGFLYLKDNPDVRFVFHSSGRYRFELLPCPGVWKTERQSQIVVIGSASFDPAAIESLAQLRSSCNDMNSNSFSLGDDIEYWKEQNVFRIKEKGISPTVVYKHVHEIDFSAMTLKLALQFNSTQSSVLLMPMKLENNWWLRTASNLSPSDAASLNTLASNLVSAALEEMTHCMCGF